MDLLEYQGKQLFAKHGVPVPEGRPATTVDEAVSAAEALGYPCVIKAQVQVGGRGKAGGIKLAQNADEAREHAEAILGMDIKGFTVHELYVEAASEIDEEYYAAFVFDRSAKKPMAMFSKMGGMDVEAVAEEDPEAMRTLHVDPLLGFQDFQGRRLAFEAGIASDVIRPVGAHAVQALRRVRGRGRDARRGRTRCSSPSRARWWPSTRRSPWTPARPTATPTTPTSWAAPPRTLRSRWRARAGSPT